MFYFNPFYSGVEYITHQCQGDEMSDQFAMAGFSHCERVEFKYGYYSHFSENDTANYTDLVCTWQAR